MVEAKINLIFHTFPIKNDIHFPVTGASQGHSALVINGALVGFFEIAECELQLADAVWKKQKWNTIYFGIYK